MNNTESFVLYESVYKQFEILKKRKPAVATDFIEAIMEYGLYGVVPDEESDVWLYGFEQSITSIQRAKDRYIASVENGRKGGRPPKNLDKDEVLQKKEELKTWKAVAKFYNISEDTLRKLRNIWKTEEPEKPKNLNDNVNDNVNEKENEKKDFSYLYDEVGCDGYVRKKKKWLDAMCWNFRAMSAQERIEYIETLDFSHEEAEHIVNNILEI